MQLLIDGAFKTELHKLFSDAVQEVAETLQAKQLPPVMKLKDACTILNINEGTLKKWRRKGLPVVEIDGIKLIRREALMKFLLDHEY